MAEKKHQLHSIKFQSGEKYLYVEENSSVLSAIQRAEIPLSATCGGQGKCGHCRVEIKKGSAPPLSDKEKHLFPQAAIDEGVRMACQVPVNGDMEIHIPRDTTSADTPLQFKGVGQSFTIQPLISSFNIEIPQPSRQDTRSDFKRISDVLITTNGQKKYTATQEVIRQLSGSIRKNVNGVTVYLRKNELIGLAPPNCSALGVAFDLGTTKIAAILLDLRTGDELSATGKLNPQISFGGDLISRLAHANTSIENAKMMAEMIRAALNEMLGSLVDDVGALRTQITDICVVGNTAMTHLLLEFPVAQLAGAPYVAATHASMDVKAADLGLQTAPAANVHIPGSIGGFVGGDHVSMILASRLQQSDQIILGIDIGTNSEIALYSPTERSLISCSCASGPAFEGGHVSCGMRAAKGAIETARFKSDNLSLSTIGNAPPQGICGSGIIDILSELCRYNIINSSGLLNKEHSSVRRGDFGLELLVAPAAETGSGKDIVITQKDISEIQLAKGAIKAGLEILLATTNTAISAVGEVIVAGAFGSRLNLESVRNIGMFPDFDNARIHQIGNAALEGAKMILLSKNERDNAGRIIEIGNHLETSNFKRFNRLFTKGIQFPKNPDRSG